MPMITGPSVGPGMLLTVLMRWPALIVVFAVGGGATFAYKEFGLPDSVELAIENWHGEPKQQTAAISDSDRVKRASPVIDHLAKAEEQTPAPTKSVPQEKPIVSEGEKYTVHKGDTLFKIAAQRNLDAATRKTFVQQVFSDNPQAFKEESPDQLLAGAVITISVVK